MKYYFDNRNFTDVYVRIFSDEKELGYAHLQKNKINVINLSENSSKIRFSFSKDKPNMKKMHSSFIAEEPFDFKKEKLNQEYRRIHDKWQFPYDCVIDAKQNRENVFLYPANFRIPKLKGGLYYKAVSVSKKSGIGMILSKKDEIREIENYRKKKIFLYFIISLTLLFLLIYSAKRSLDVDITGYDRRGLSYTALGSLIGFLYCSHVMNLNLQYDGMFKEKALKDTYYISEEGVFTDF